MRMKWVLPVCLCLMVAGGCGSKEEASAPKPKPPVKVPQAASADGSAAPGAPVPPPAPEAPAPAAPQADSPVASPGAPVASTPTGDPLFYFRQGPNGQRSDLEALQYAVESYGRTAGISEGDKPARPSLKGKDLSLLVSTGYLKALPEAPEGHHYYLDPQTLKVSLK